MRAVFFQRISLALFLFASGSLFAQDPAVQLLLPSRILEPRSTFDLRFASEMVPPDQIGKPADVSPLVFEPAVAGQFVWLSSRSGTFVPEGVLPLGTKFQISLRANLRNAAGKPIAAKLRETAETPPFRIKGSSAVNYVDNENATVVPRFLVLFNANVNAVAAAKFSRFVDAAGTRIDARVEQANDPAQRERRFNAWNSDDRSLLTWGEKATDAAAGGAAEEGEQIDDPLADKPPARRDNILYVTPAKPLPPGRDWRLVFEAGLPAAQWNAALPASHEIPVGEVKPFGVTKVSPETNRVAGRRVLLEFSKALAEDITSENITRWIKVEPTPLDLQTLIEDSFVTIRGGFELGTRYRVTVERGLPSSDPVETTAPFTKEVVFDKVAPRLYFQDFAAHQYAGGTRQLRLLSVNVPRMRVTAKLFTGDEIPAALKAYDAYMEAPAEGVDEMFSRVDAEGVPGKVVWQQEFTPGGEIDSQQMTALNWDELVDANRTGAVMLTAESLDPLPPNNKRVGTQTVMQLTDLGAVWKRSRDDTWLHVFSLASGKGVAGARLRLLSGEGAELAQGTADERGEARLPQNDEMRWVFVETNGDAHLISLASGENEVPLYRLGVTEEMVDVEDGRYSRSIFMFTERGVYKPGDKVFLKGYAQDLRAGQPRIPAGKPVTVTVADAKERPIFSRELTLSDFGSFAEEITIPEGSLGRYRVLATGQKGERLGGSAYFQVQEYRANAFEISIPVPPPTVGPTQLTLPITAKYLMGKPLTRAKLTWSLVARDDPFRPDGLSDFVFGSGIFDFRLNRALDRVSQFNAQGELAIGDNGTAQLTTAFPLNPKAPQPRAAKLLCEVTDLNQQTVSESRSWVQHSSEYYFGLRRLDGVVKEGAPLPIELVALRPDGKPLDEPARATIRLTRINWQTNRLAGAGDTTEFESKPQLQVEWERELATVPGVGDDRKPNSARLDQAVAGKAGEYLLEAVGKDGRGNDILTSMVIEVSGDGEMAWDYRNPYVIDVIADKESYEPGQTATLLVKTPIAGDALVTVERDRVLRSFVVPLTGNAPTVQVPIAATDGPNVHVSVMLLRGANDSPRKVKTPEYRIGYCNLKVARPQDKLTVEVRPGNRTSMPGEKVHIEAIVRDSGNTPAADAEVTLYAVDEGVLSLTGYETPHPLAFFNQPRGVSVSTSLTLPTLLKEDAVESDFANKGYLVGDGKGGAAMLNGLRKNFIATPFWSATLRTDAEGRVRADFPAPDSLTRYRIIAVAATKQSQYGNGASAVEINKPIMIESAMPAFAHIGDKLTLRAVVHNTTNFAGRAEVFLETDKLARASEPRRQITLAAQASVPIDIPVEITSTGVGKWKWAVKFIATDGNAEVWDAVQTKIKVRHAAPLIRQVETGRVENDKADLLRISDPQIIEGDGEVTVNLANTRVVALGESLRQLLEYPYGCVEQTTSSILPWLTVRDLRGTLPELAKPDEEIAHAVNSGIRLLLSMQTSSGGMSYWPKGREPMLWGSAYAALAFTLAQQQGFAVPEAEYSQLLKYLSDELRGTAKDVSGYGLSDRCLAVYSLAMAGKAEPAYHDLLFQKRAKLSAEDRALVALAIIESKGPKQMIEGLLNAPAADAVYFERWFGSVARENALHLLAWTLHQPRAPRVDQLATELFARRANGHWRTTQGNVWSLLALASYLRNVETGSRDSRGAIAWGQASSPFALSNLSPLATATFPIDPGTVRQPVTLTKAGGHVYSEVTVLARSKVAEQPRQEQGYSLTRRYAKVGDDGRLSSAENLRVGDRILVTLDVDATRRATYVALEDRLPGVFAPINPAFKSQEVVAGESLGTEWVSDYHELREDRAVFFIDYLNPGRYTLRYLARVVSAGEAIAPAAKIEEMYHPERFGTTEAVRVSAKPLE